MDASDMLVKDLGTIQRGRIRVEMNEIKDTKRDNARQLVQLAQKECS